MLTHLLATVLLAGTCRKSTEQMVTQLPCVIVVVPVRCTDSSLLARILQTTTPSLCSDGKVSWHSLSSQELN